MICPLCNSSDMVPIWYGHPTLDDIILARAGRVVLGGVKEKEYTHYCNNCHETYPFIEVAYDD